MNEPGSHDYNSTSWNNAVERSRIPRQFADSIIAQHTGACGAKTAGASREMEMHPALESVAQS
jgi:hypothetical protein